MYISYVAPQQKTLNHDPLFKNCNLWSNSCKMLFFMKEHISVQWYNKAVFMTSYFLLWSHLFFYRNSVCLAFFGTFNIIYFVKNANILNIKDAITKKNLTVTQVKNTFLKAYRDMIGKQLSLKLCNICENCWCKEIYGIARDDSYVL